MLTRVFLKMTSGRKSGPWLGGLWVSPRSSSRVFGCPTVCDRIVSVVQIQELQSLPRKWSSALRLRTVHPASGSGPASQVSMEQNLIGGACTSHPPRTMWGLGANAYSILEYRKEYYNMKANPVTGSGRGLCRSEAQKSKGM